MLKSDAIVYGVVPSPLVLRSSAFALADGLTQLSGGKNVPKDIVVFGDNDGNGARKAPSKLKAVGKATLAQALLLAAYETVPMAYDATVAYFGKSGIDAETAANSPNKSVQASVVDVLLRNGVPVQLAESAAATAKEIGAYKLLLQKHRDAADAQVSANQSARPSSGSAELDRVNINLEIEEICRGMGMNSTLYAKLLRGLNTHTAEDVEIFQLHRNLYGMQAI
jgi:hypothetical protein